MNMHTGRYEDILFHNRNQAYGGYELRVHYPRRAFAALLLGTALASTLILIQAAGGQADPPITFQSAAAERSHELTYVILPKPPGGGTPAAAKPVRQMPQAKPSNTPPVIVPDDAAKNPTPSSSTMKPGMDNSGAAGSGTGPGGGAGGNGLDSSGSPDGALVVKPPTGPIKIAEVMPAFRGNLEQWLARNLRYPESARLAGQQGRVVVQFVVETGGSISDVQVMRSVSATLDAEAVRVVKAMPPWKPGMQNGQPVRVLFAMPITFVLE